MVFSLKGHEKPGYWDFQEKDDTGSIKDAV